MLQNKHKHFFSSKLLIRKKMWYKETQVYPEKKTLRCLKEDICSTVISTGLYNLRKQGQFCKYAGVKITDAFRYEFHRQSLRRWCVPRTLPNMLMNTEVKESTEHQWMEATAE